MSRRRKRKHFSNDFGFELSDIGDVVKKPFEAAADVATSVIDRIPGSDTAKGWINAVVDGPLKDFANTTVGHIVLTAATAAFQYSPAALALSATLGPTFAGALAVASIALPNMIAGDEFFRLDQRSNRPSCTDCSILRR